MSRRGNRYSGQQSTRDGTPTGEPRPQAIDDFSGFKVPLDKLERNWDGLMTVSPDIRNPQDFVRGVKDNMSLPFARPEAPDVFAPENIIWENGDFMTTEQGAAILTESEAVYL